MIAKIGRGSNLFGTLSYNNVKMEQEKGEILLMNKMIETPDGSYSVAQLARSFEPYLLANRNTEKHTLHISLNPDPKDKVSDEQYKEIAEQYMNEMGYGDQPFIVFKHTDIDRSHIHIVSVCVDEEGKKISDRFEKVRSMKVCRELEKKFGLISAVKKQSRQDPKILRPIDLNSGDIKSQISSVIRHIPSYYQFQSLGEYNALLSLFNITVEKVEGELQGQLKRGLLYFSLNDKSEKVGSPIKASLFGKKACIDALEKHFFECKNKSNDQVKDNLKRSINEAHLSSKDEQIFKKKLKKEGIDTVVRRNDNGRVYGITFIDHTSRTVYNGSRLGKECSANVFNDYWTNRIKQGIKEHITVKAKPKISISNHINLSRNEPNLFDFLNTSNRHEDGLTEALGGLLPEAQSEDQEEKDFNEKIKNRRKYRRKRT